MVKYGAPFLAQIDGFVIPVHQNEHLGILPPFVQNCSSDLPSTRVRVLHMTVVDVTNSLKSYHMYLSLNIYIYIFYT